MLQRWSRRPKSPHSIAQRARIVLLAADDLSNKDVADKVGVNPATVLKWRKRFLERRLDGLIDEPRPGAPRSIGDAEVEAVVVRTLEETPTDATHWSTRDLAKKVGMSPSSVGRIWQAFGLKPWLTDSFKLSADPQFVDKVRDVVGIYITPWCSASTKRPASKPWTAPSRHCRCARVRSNAGPMTTSAMV